MFLVAKLAAFFDLQYYIDRYLSYEKCKFCYYNFRVYLTFENWYNCEVLKKQKKRIL